MWEYKCDVASRKDMMEYFHLAVYKFTSYSGNDLGHNFMLYTIPGKRQKILKSKPQKDNIWMRTSSFKVNTLTILRSVSHCSVTYTARTLKRSRCTCYTQSLQFGYRCLIRQSHVQPGCCNVLAVYVKENPCYL